MKNSPHPCYGSPTTSETWESGTKSQVSVWGRVGDAWGHDCLLLTELSPGPKSPGLGSRGVEGASAAMGACPPALSQARSPTQLYRSRESGCSSETPSPVTALQRMKENHLKQSLLSLATFQGVSSPDRSVLRLGPKEASPGP